MTLLEHQTLGKPSWPSPPCAGVEAEACRALPARRRRCGPRRLVGPVGCVLAVLLAVLGHTCYGVVCHVMVAQCPLDCFLLNRYGDRGRPRGPLCLSHAIEQSDP